MNVNVDHHRKPSTTRTSFLDGEIFLPKLFQEEEFIILATSPNQKPDPFYISFFINGNRLSNCIIDSWASDNVMPISIAKALGLPLTRNLGNCYSMDAK